MVVVLVLKSGVFEKEEISLQDLISMLKKNPEISKVGGIGIFIGITRGFTKTGEKVKKLEIESFDEKANIDLQKISDDLKDKEGVIDVAICHFKGEFDIGDDLVYCIVAASHRQDIFSTLQEAIEGYKKEAALWKKEYLKSGESYWISESKSH